MSDQEKLFDEFRKEFPIGPSPTHGYMDWLSSKLLTTRRQLEIAREALEIVKRDSCLLEGRTGNIASDVDQDSWYIAARDAPEAINKEGRS